MAKLRQVGNSLVVTIPAGIARQFGLRAGDDVEVEPDGDGLRLVPMLRVRRHRAEGAADHETEARALLRRYHSELHAALERAEAEADGEQARTRTLTRPADDGNRNGRAH